MQFTRPGTIEIGSKHFEYIWDMIAYCKNCEHLVGVLFNEKKLVHIADVFNGSLLPFGAPLKGKCSSTGSFKRALDGKGCQCSLPEIRSQWVA